MDKLNWIARADSGPVFIYISSDRHEPEKEDESDCKCISELVNKQYDGEWSMCELVVHDWDTMLTPWEADNCLKGRHFAGQASKQRKYLEEVVFPEITKQVPGASGVYIVGYSLAGLFALWMAYQSDNLSGDLLSGTSLTGAVCCSGSLWYPGWKEYMLSHDIPDDRNIYLSLGDRESSTKHPIMKQVGDNTSLQYNRLLEDDHVSNVTMEWNEGGHFNNVTARIAKGIFWTLTTCNPL